MKTFATASRCIGTQIYREALHRRISTFPGPFLKDPKGSKTFPLQS